MFKFGFLRRQQPDFYLLSAYRADQTVIEGLGRVCHDRDSAEKGFKRLASDSRNVVELKGWFPDRPLGKRMVILRRKEPK